MTTLTTAPLAPLLGRLFDAAEASWSKDSPAVQYWASLSEEEQDRLMRSKSDYRDFYANLKDAPLAVSRSTGTLLYMLARGIRATKVVEFGTSFGLSTLHLAAAVRDNGGGHVITTEFEPSKAARAAENFEAAGLSDLIEIREGDALQTLSAGLPETIDLLLLDGAKGLYADILRLVDGHLRPGSLIVADDAEHCPEYLDHVRTSGNGYLSVPLGPEVELSLRIG